jgi:peptidoglycan/xylan/chitin deacetylase (PgdA/CDA1 family)
MLLMLYLMIVIYHWVLGAASMVQSSSRVEKHSKPDIRVLNFHDIPTGKRRKFIRQIERVQEKRRFIDVAEFSRLMKGESKLLENVVLLTFDDGFRSNYEVATEILNPRKIKAVFFVIPEFVEITNDVIRLQFIQQRLFPAQKISDKTKKLTSMSWVEIKQLIKDGHTIGCHTGSHARLSDIQDHEKLWTEIVDSGNKIEEKTGIGVEHFAYTFGDISSMSQEALFIAGRRYRYVHSALRGCNYPTTNRLAIRRETVHPWDPLNFVIGVLDGVADFQYQKARKVLDGWANKANS